MGAKREDIYLALHKKMEKVGFIFEAEQTPHMQKRKEKELKFIHPSLVEKFELTGNKARATKFYVKPLSDSPNCEIGFVTGKSSSLFDTRIFPKANATDTHGDVPAWVNRQGDKALDSLLLAIQKYLYYGNNWSDEELEAAVISYMEMRKKALAGEKFIKKSYYADLAKQFNRTEKAFEFRMQNISYVYSSLGRDWVTGFKPAKNVGVKVAQRIEELINGIEESHSNLPATFQAQVDSQLSKTDIEIPKGTTSPEKLVTSVTQYKRNACVVAYVLKKADGICECCGNNAPFSKDNGELFLEVHHLKRLADGGSDTICNAVAICPNCHRELHYGGSRKKLLSQIYLKNERLESN